MRRFLVVMTACLWAAPTIAQVPPLASTLTAQQVQEAIDWGTGKIKINGKKTDIRLYEIDSETFLVTPFLRVALAAKDAQERYTQFGPVEAAAEITDRLCHITVNPIDHSQRPGTSPLESYSSAEGVLIMPSKSDGAAQAIKPVWTKPYVHTLKNAMGLTMETVTLVAAFPCEVVTPGNDVVIIRENSRLSKKSYRLSIKKELLKWR